MPTVLRPPIFKKDLRDAVKDPLEKRLIAEIPTEDNLFLTELDGDKLQKTIHESWTVGDITDDYIYFFANVEGLTTTPSIRYNKVEQRWEFDSGDGNFIPLGGGAGGLTSYVHIQSIDSDSWNVLHNIGVGIIYTITDEFHNVIEPEDVRIIDGNSLNIEFLTPVKGIAYILRTEYIHTQVANNTWVVNHGLGTNQVAYKLIGSDGYEMLPQSVEITDTNTLTITFNAAVEGTCNVAGIGYEYDNATPHSDWAVAHNLATRTLAYMITDVTQKEIQPHNVQLTNDNLIDITFLSNVDGYAEIVEA